MPQYKKAKGKVTIKFDLPSEDGTRRQKTLSGFASQREADIGMVRFLSEYTPPMPAPATGYTLRAVAERFLAFQSTRVKNSSYVVYRGCIERHVLPTFGQRDIAHIAPTEIVAWQAELVKQEYSHNHNKAILQAFKALMRYAVDIEEIIKDSPIKSKIRFRRDKVKTEKPIYTPAEYQQFRAVINRPIDYIIFDLLYYTGMRRGELLALQWSDFNGNTVSISKTLTRKTTDGKPWAITSPKSANSTRKVPLPPFLADSLNAWRTEMRPKPTAYIIGDEEPNNDRYLENRRDAYCEAAGLRRILLHEFRHSHVSYLFSANIDAVSIAKRVGDTVDTILTTYAHFVPDRQTEILSQISAIAPPKSVTE